MGENSKKRTALVAGATGLIGSHCVAYLLANPVYEKVGVLVRRPLEMEHPKLQQIITDYGHLENYADAINADHVFCCLGTTMRKAGSKQAFRKVDFSYVYSLAQLAYSGGARQFLMVSSMGADKDSLIFYSRVKGEIEDAVKKIPFRAIHIFRPSLLLGHRTEKRSGEKLGIILSKLLGVFMVGPLKKYRGIEAKAVAEVMVQQATAGMSGIHIYPSDRIQWLRDRDEKEDATQ